MDDLEVGGSPTGSSTDSLFLLNDTLVSFATDLPSLENGTLMFGGCSLTSFAGELSSLTNGYMMFVASDVTNFNTNLNSLNNGTGMFSNCYNLTSFNPDLSSLTNGSYMFQSCTALSSFNSDLSSLTNGTGMFYNCNLNSDSIINIANTINNVNHLIGTTDMMTGQTITEIPIDLGTIPSDSDVSSAIEQIENKGWTIYSNN